MTANQINAAAQRETARANQAREAETERSNRVNESETKRSNQAKEKLTKRDQNIKIGSSVVSGIGSLAKGAGGVASLLKVLGVNDPSWYDHNPEATKAVANVSYQVPVGTQSKFLTENLGSFTTNKGEGVPGIFVMPFVPTIGGKEGTAINTAAFKLYTWVRHVNSGSRNYEAVDYAMYVLSADSIMTNVAWFTRILTVVNAFSAENSYRTAYALLKAEGLPDTFIDDLKNNAANYRARFNTLIASINSIAIPHVFDYVTRHVWMATNYFADRNKQRSQIYMFKPKGYFTFKADSTTSEEAGALEFKIWSGSKFSAYLDILEAQINAILQIEDLAIMSGDTLKAFGDNGIYRLPAYTGDEQINVLYSDEVLSQIESAQILNTATWVSPSYPYCIYQKSGIIYQGMIDGSDTIRFMYGGQGGGSGAGYPSTAAVKNILAKRNAAGYLINAYKENMEPRDTMVSTRLIPILDDNDVIYGYGNPNGSGQWAAVKSCGSEVLVDAYITNFEYNLTTGERTWNSRPVSATQMLGTATTAAQVAYTAFLISTFNHHPTLISFTANGEGSDSVTFNYFFAEVDDYAEVEVPTIQNMHRVALLSLFSADQSGYKKSKF